VALFGAPYATAYRLHSQIRLRLETQCARIARHARALRSLSGPQRGSYIREKLKFVLPSNRNGGQESGLSPSGGDSSDVTDSVAQEVKTRRVKVQNATFAALASYTPTHFPGRLVLLLPCNRWARSSRQPLRWRSVADRAEEHYGPNDCHTDVMLLEPYAALFAKLFGQACTTCVNHGLLHRSPRHALQSQTDHY
jgi:hypothetical protein